MEHLPKCRFRVDPAQMRAVCVVVHHPDKPGWFHLFTSDGQPPKVACSDGEAESRARHLVSRNGGSFWILDRTGYPIYAETVPAMGDTGLRGGNDLRSSQL